MTTSPDVELGPCPFCGGPAQANESDDHWYVICRSRDCFAALGEAYDGYAMPDHAFETEAEAIAAWNTRATLSPTLPPDREGEEDWRIEGSIYGGFEAAIVKNGVTAAHVVKYADAVTMLAALSTSPPVGVERLREALAWIELHFANQDMSHSAFRVEAYRRARAALSTIPLPLEGLSHD